MKLKSIIMFFAVAVMALSAYAQPQGGFGQMDPEERIKNQIERMKTDLTLNEDQVKKVEVVIRKYSKKQSEMFEEMRNGGGGGDFTQMREKMQTMREEQTKELKPIFTAEQLKKYEELEKEREEQRRQRMGGGGGPGGPGGQAPERRGAQRGTGN